MKKIIFSMLALAALSSCVKEQTIETQQPNAIKFANTFVENATRTNNPVTDTDNIEEIYVWGIVANETGIVFDDEKVWKSGSQWTYGETQYWTPGNDYWFSAIAGDRSNDQIVIKTAADGGMSTEGLGTVTFTNASGVNDVLYAEYKTTTSNSLNEVPDPVKFQFQHLLSKVQFTFKNGFQNNNNTVVVTGIEMDVPAVGVIDLTQDELAWTGLQDELTLDMGTMNNEEHVTIGKSAVSDNVRFTIPAPATQTYAIRFHVALYMGDVLAYETDMTSAVTGVALEMGKAYNFTATIDQNSLDLHKIEFNVGVTDWADYVDVQHPVIATYNDVAYYSLQEAVDAATGNATVYLISDVKENVTITQKEGVNLVIEGNNKKYDGVITINGNARSTGAETLTIQNIQFETIHNIDTEESQWTFIVAPSKIDGKYNYSHNVTIQGCTFKNLVDGILRVGSASFTGAYNIVMKDCSATNMHSLLQTQSIDNTVKVEKVTVVDSKNGISFGNTAFPTLKDATINTTGYGVRADGNADRGALVVENVTIDANRPIVVRKATKPYSVTVTGTNEITAGDGYDVIFTKGDDEGALSAPDAANVNYNGPATLSVYPGYSDAENTYVATVDALQEALEEVVAGTEDKNIVLSGDIDLASLMTRSAVASNWTPIGTSEKPFTGVFDGNGFTIKNLALVEAEAKEGKAYIGFFGYAKDATIKNVTFENVYINIPCLDIDHSQGHIGAVAGSLEGTSTIENVTVKGDIQVYATQEANGASRVAVVAGGNSYGNVTMKNVHVIANEGSYLKANNNTGALAGQLQGKSVFENCSSNIDVTVNKFFAGGLIGIAPADATFTNCHTTGNVSVVAGRAGRGNDHYRVGGIAGGWADGAKNVCTLTGCTYTGKLTGVNADGSVAKAFDYDGYVGRGYTLNGCKGSKVVIDGKEFVQLNDTDHGVYVINGTTVTVATADALVAALATEYDVLFTNDIKINPASMSNAYGKTGINVKYGQTIDGNGCTLNIQGAGGTWDSGINTTGGLIKNLTVTGSFRGIFINHNSDHSEKVVLENVTIGGNGTVYTISCDQGLYQGIEATNCTFNGWTSFAKTAGEAKFVNCNFGEGSGYKYCRPYSNTEFVGCTFCPGYAVDETRATVTFTDCTWE